MPSDEQLVIFIITAFSKGFDEDHIRQGLLQKGWPIQKVQEAILEAKNRTSQVKTEQTEQKTQIEVTPEKIKEIQGQSEEVKLKKTDTGKNILLIAFSFLGIFLILSFTFLVFSYMQNIRDYRVANPQTGELLEKTCLNPDCSDMRKYAGDQTLKAISSKSFFNPLILGFELSLLLVIVYELINFKKLFFWIANIIYFIFIIIMAIIWISFSRGP